MCNCLKFADMNDFFMYLGLQVCKFCCDIIFSTLNFELIIAVVIKKMELNI